MNLYLRTLSSPALPASSELLGNAAFSESVLSIELKSYFPLISVTEERPADHLLCFPSVML